MVRVGEELVFRYSEDVAAFFGIGIDNYAVRRVSEDRNSRTSLKPRS
jgi:hypothetical protein